METSNTLPVPAKNGGKAKKEEPTPKTEQTTDSLTKQLQSIVTIQDIEEKTGRLNSLFSKREKLLEAKEKLVRFDLSTDSHSLSVRFSDDTGNNFSTGNRDVIQKLMKTVQENITSSLVEVDIQIRRIFE